MKRQIRTYAQATEPAGTDLVAQIHAQADRVAARLATVRSTILVASGKGGVGKSFVASTIAAALARRGRTVGALDADLNGPSLARMLGVHRERLRVDARGVHPARTRAGCTVMSTDLLLETPDAPLRWREPAAGGFVWQSALETGMLREFISDVYWGDLDVLLIDLPPGTDKIARILPLLPAVTATIVVTTPSVVANAAVDRSITQLRAAPTGAIAVVRNMDGYYCPYCRAVSPLFAAHNEDSFASIQLHQSQPSSLYPDSAHAHEPAHEPAHETAHEPAHGRESAPRATSRQALDHPDGDIRESIPFDPRAAASTDAGEDLPHDSPVREAIERLLDRIEPILPDRLVDGPGGTGSLVAENDRNRDDPRMLEEVR